MKMKDALIYVQHHNRSELKKLLQTEVLHMAQPISDAVLCSCCKAVLPHSDKQNVSYDDNIATKLVGNELVAFIPDKDNTIPPCTPYHVDDRGNVAQFYHREPGNSSWDIIATLDREAGELDSSWDGDAHVTDWAVKHDYIEVKTALPI